MSQATFLEHAEFERRKKIRQETPIPVLDGFVQLIDVMGDEQCVCEAARVTSQQDAKTLGEDYGLIRYLMRHRHTTPLEMVELKFRVKVAMDTWRQWIRHRTASVNEYSTRYSPAIDEAQRTCSGEWRLQSIVNRQGSAGAISGDWPPLYWIFPMSDDGEPILPAIFPKDRIPEHTQWGLFRFFTQEALDDCDFEKSELMLAYSGAYAEFTPGAYLTAREGQQLDDARETYEERLAFGVAKEQARKDLPLSTMTMAVWKIDLHNLLHFLSLRMDGHAQLEIRSYANAIGLIVEQLYPVVWEAFKQYRLNAMQLTELDIGVIRVLVDNGRLDGGSVYDEADFAAACPPQWREAKRSRERDECLAKLQKLGLVRADAAA